MATTAQLGRLDGRTSRQRRPGRTSWSAMDHCLSCAARVLVRQDAPAAGVAVAPAGLHAAAAAAAVSVGRAVLRGAGGAQPAVDVGGGGVAVAGGAESEAGRQSGRRTAHVGREVGEETDGGGFGIGQTRVVVVGYLEEKSMKACF